MADARLLVEVAGDAAHFHRTMGRVVREGEAVRAQAMQMAKTSAAAIAAIGTTSAAAVTAMAVQASNDMRELRREAEILGTTAGELSTWEYAARSVGLEVDKVGDIFKDVNDKIGDFVRTGGGEAADVFEQLGLNAQDFIGLAPEQAILRIGDALEGLSQGEKTFFMESLADDASRLIPLLDNNAERFRTLAEEGRNFGAIVTNEQAEVASGFADTLAEAKRMAGGFKTQLGVGLAPTFEGILDYLEDVTDGFGGPKEAAQATALAIVGAMEDAVSGISTFMGELDTAYGYYLQIRKFQSQVEGFGGVLNNIATNDHSEIPQGIKDAMEWQRQIDELNSGGGWGSQAREEFQSLRAHMEAASNQAIPELNDSAVTAASNIGILANSVRDTAEAMATSRNNLVQQMTGTGSGVLPTSTQAAVPALAGPPAAGLNLSSIRPMSADQFTDSGAVSAALSGSGGQGSGKTHTIRFEVGDKAVGEVQGDDAFTARLVDALQGAAGSVSSQ